MDRIGCRGAGIVSAGDMSVDTDKVDQLSVDDHYVRNGPDGQKLITVMKS